MAPAKPFLLAQLTLMNCNSAYRQDSRPGLNYPGRKLETLQILTMHVEENLPAPNLLA